MTGDRPGLISAWRELAPEYRQASLAAAGLIGALFLPWYEKSAFVQTRDGEAIAARETLSAFEVISFVEAAIALVALSVMALVLTRALDRPFHLPGGDGTAIALAGAWAVLLLVWRLFDKPHVVGVAVTVGVQWGWFVAVVVAAVLTAAGLRLRAAHRPEPPNPIAA